MKSLGADGWINYGWGENLSDDQINYQDKLHVVFSRQSIPSLQFKDAAQKTIDKIVKQYPPPYTLMCSGGVDSQAMIWAWVTSGYDFSIVSVKYISNNIWYNDYDQEKLIEFCSKNKIEIDFKSIDIKDFLENDLKNYAVPFDCSSPQICTHMKIASLVNKGTVLFSGNYIFDKKTSLSYTLLGLHRFGIHKSSDDYQIIPFFLCHDPHLAYCFNHLEPLKSYLNAGIPLSIPAKKFNGFEKIKLEYDEITILPIDRLRFYNKPSHRPFDIMFRHPYEPINNSNGKNDYPLFLEQ